MSPALGDLIHCADDSVELHCPRSMPKASTLLWNRRLLLQLNCRGYASAIHMQPEPGKYARAPVLEATTFLQPEQPHYAHHPGRFVYLIDEESGALFSVPHEPVRASSDRFVFRARPDGVDWELDRDELHCQWSVGLPAEDAIELWTLRLQTGSQRARRLRVCLYFPLGYMSWMNQSARYSAEMGGVVARCISGYQKREDWPRVAGFKDHTVLLHESPPDSWECRQAAFEGEGGLQWPDALRAAQLPCGEALYEVPAACLQYCVDLAPGESTSLRFAFGPAGDESEIRALRRRYLSGNGFESALSDRAAELAPARDALRLRTPDALLDAFVQPWLCRQALYLGTGHRFCTDPQTRNYLQDAMGLALLDPELARGHFVRVLEQQEEEFGLPDGVLLHAEAELKYINQIPHSDHALWLPICLAAWLEESGDHAFLRTRIRDRHGHELSVAKRVDLSLRWLLQRRDTRGLCLIGHGDWCDPMNMAGHLGRGVSGWLSIALVHALRVWADVCEQSADLLDENPADALRGEADALGEAVQTWLWDGDWFARGITDHGRSFGVRADEEGRIFLNPQAWALLAGLGSQEQQSRMCKAVDTHLQTPSGLALCDPPFTRMHEDIGRVTQKFPGSAENGSVYSHAVAFHINGLYAVGEGERAFALLRQLLPCADAEAALARGQLPVFIPNYYRGAHRLHPNVAGRSSQLPHSGAVAWLLRALLRGLFGLHGERHGLRIQPQLPRAWSSARIVRRFRGSLLDIEYIRHAGPLQVSLDGVLLSEPMLRGLGRERRYHVQIRLPST
jgi:cellobionic acid phosphorylase